MCLGDPRGLVRSSRNGIFCYKCLYIDFHRRRISVLELCRELYFWLAVNDYKIVVCMATQACKIETQKVMDGNMRKQYVDVREELPDIDSLVFRREDDVKEKK